MKIRHGMRARCVDGPYAGQTFGFPYPKIHWSNFEMLSQPTRVGRQFPVSREELPVAELVWIIDGPDRHCYQPIENANYGTWRLVYRDTF